MDQILEIKEKIIRLIKKNEILLMYVLKLFLGILVYLLVDKIQFYDELFKPILGGNFNVIYILLMSLFFILLPLNVNYIFIILNIVLHISCRLDVSIITLLILLMIFMFYGHFNNKESFFIIITVISFYFKIPYIVPILGGTYFGIKVIIPVIIGLFIWVYTKFMIEFLFSSWNSSLEISNNIEIFKDYLYFLKESNLVRDSIILSICLSINLIFTHIISNFKINYGKVICVIFSTVANIIMFCLTIYIFDLNISMGNVFIMNLISCSIMFIILFFDDFLDYKRADNVIFEDDDNVYYVKIVPKIKRYKKYNNISSKKDSMSNQRIR